MTDNNYWQFQNMVNTSPLMLSQQQQQQQQTQQQSWSKDNDESKWSQTFGDFDLNAQANSMFSKLLINICKHKLFIFLNFFFFFTY